MQADGVGSYVSRIADVRAAIESRIAIEYLSPASTPGHADAIFLTYDWCHIRDHEQRRAICRKSEKCKYRIAAIISHNPLKSIRLAVALMQGRLGNIKAIEIADDALDAGVERVFDRRPIEVAVVIPLALLRELAAHEQKLLPWMGPHEAEIGAQVSKPLPAIAAHLADQRAFSIDDFIV